MKTGSNFCWQLIRSMSSGEKTFFKRNFANNSDKPGQAYLRLFDAMAKQKEYDEAALLKKFKEGISRKQLAGLKHYLQQQVCNAIIEYDNLHNQKADIYHQIQLIRVLRRKGMLQEALTAWKKAVSQARSQEAYAKLNLLKAEFVKMIIFSSMQIRYDELHTVFKSHTITYDVYAELITLRDIYTELLLLKRKSHYDIDEDMQQRIISLQERINRASKPSGRSFWYRHYYEMNHATLLYLRNQPGDSLRILKTQWLHWKNNRHFVSEEGEFYIELLYMINYAGAQQGDFDYVLTVFQDPLNQLIRDPVHRANFEAIRFMALNKVYNKTARYDLVEALLGDMKARYNQWEPLLNPDLNRTINLSVGIACFVLEQYEDALYFFKRGLTHYKDGAREEHAAIAQILLLMTCYCMNNSRLFDAQHRNTYQYFYKRKKKRPFETALVQCLHRTFYMPDMKNKIRVYQEALDLFEKHKDDPVQQMTFNIFNYPGWLQSRIERIPYRAYVEQKVKKQRAPKGQPQTDPLLTN